jgi:hypothetical protein
MTTRNLSLPEFFERALRAGLDDLRVGLPARVERYDAALQRADVQPLLKTAFIDEEGKRQVERVPVIPAVPVIFPQGGGYRLTFPLAEGDTVWLTFSSASLDLWLQQGGEVDPGDDRRGHLADAVAYAGIRDFAHPLQDAPADVAAFGRDGGPSIYVSPSEVRIGANSGLQPAVLGDALQSHLQTLKTYLDTLVLPVSGPSAGPPAVPSPAPSGLLSEKVKVAP